MRVTDRLRMGAAAAMAAVVEVTPGTLPAVRP
jgi:hypothetical protein